MTTTINADNGAVSGSAGLKSSADATGVLALQTNGTTAVTVDASQNVGIGTTSPTNYANQRTLAVNGTTYGRIDLMAGGTVYGSLYGGTGGPTLSTGSALPVMFETNGTERMRINAGAPILCLVGGSTTATGTGIAFPATQSASTDANTLDDYEEGTWTPTQGAGLTVVGTFSSSGTYTKIGRQVTIFGIVSGSTTVAVTASNTAICAGLPAAIASTSTSYPGLALNNNTTASMPIQVTTTTIFAAGTMSATANIFFSATYFV